MKAIDKIALNLEQIKKYTELNLTIAQKYNDENGTSVIYDWMLQINTLVKNTQEKIRIMSPLKSE